MDAAGPQAALRDLESAAFAEQNVGGGNADVGEGHLGVAVRGMIVTENGEHALDLDAGSVERDQNHRLLFMFRRRRIGFAHENRDLAARIAARRWTTICGR